MLFVSTLFGTSGTFDFGTVGFVTTIGTVVLAIADLLLFVGGEGWGRTYLIFWYAGGVVTVKLFAFALFHCKGRVKGMREVVVPSLSSEYTLPMNSGDTSTMQMRILIIIFILLSDNRFKT